MTTPDFHFLFHPRSVAIIGATSHAWGGGGLMLKSVTANNFPGRIYPVHPREKELAGLPVYRDVFEVPGEIDMAIIAIPARGVLAVIEQCHQRGIKFAVIHSSGFGELNQEGKRLEAEMAAIAARGNPRIIGPNSMGIYCPRASFDTVVTYEPVTMEAGPVSFVGQSGWGSENFTRLGIEQGLRYSKVVSIGNQCDLATEDLVRYFGADPETRVIALHVEGFRRPKEFLELAGEITPHKPVIVWKAGRTEASARASASHTGSLASNALVTEAGFRQAGIISASGLRQLVSLTAAFVSPVLPAGNRVGLVLSSGGAGIASCDALAATDLKLVDFPADVQQELRDYLTTITGIVPNVTNPVDLGWLPTWGKIEPYLKVLQIVLRHVDLVMLMCFMPLSPELLSGLIELRDSSGKPIVVVPGHSMVQREGMSLFTKNGIPSYAFPEDAICALDALWRYARRKY